jgi:hypothetical protein
MEDPNDQGALHRGQRPTTCRRTHEVPTALAVGTSEVLKEEGQRLVTKSWRVVFDPLNTEFARGM